MYYADEVMIDTIADGQVIEDDEIVLVDYKTDRTKDEEELVKRYKIQLELYKRALEASTGKKVKDTYIYSFALAKEVNLGKY